MLQAAFDGGRGFARLHLAHLTFEARQEDAALAHLKEHLSWVVQGGRDTCAGCGQTRGEDTPMLTCSGCRVARFCSADHQKMASKKAALGGSLTTGRRGVRLRRVIPVGTAQFTDWLITGFVGGSAYLILMQMESQIEEGPGHLDQKVFMPSDQSRQALAFRCLIPELAAGRYDLQVSVHDASKLSEVVCVTNDANQGMIFSYLITKIGLIYLNIRSILTMTDAYLRHASIRGINH